MTFAGITVQSSILSSNMVGSAQIKWKDILRFEHVKVRIVMSWYIYLFFNVFRQ